MTYVCTHIAATAQACGIWLLVISGQISSASAQTTLQTIDFDAIRARNGMMHNDSGAFQPIQINTVLYAYGANNNNQFGLGMKKGTGADKPNLNLMIEKPQYYWYKDAHNESSNSWWFNNGQTSHANMNSVRFFSDFYMDAEEQHKKNQVNE